MRRILGCQPTKLRSYTRVSYSFARSCTDHQRNIPATTGFGKQYSTGNTVVRYALKMFPPPKSINVQLFSDEQGSLFRHLLDSSTWAIGKTTYATGSQSIFPDDFKRRELGAPQVQLQSTSTILTTRLTHQRLLLFPIGQKRKGLWLLQRL